MSRRALADSLLLALTLALLTAPWWPGSCGAQTCVDYDTRLHWLGSQPVAGLARGVAADNDLFVVLKGVDGFELYRLPPEESPLLLASVAAIDSTLEALFVPPLLFVADGARIVTYDISVPAAAAPVDTLTLATDRVRTLCHANNQLVACCGDAGLVLIDYGDPEDLQVAATLPLASPGALDAAADNDLVVVGAGDTLYTVDCATYGSPAILGQLALPGLASRVALSGYTACTAGSSAGARLVDVSDPVHPLEGTTIVGGHPRELCLSSGFLFLSETSLRVYGLTTPQGVTYYYGSSALPSSSLTGAAQSGQQMALLGDVLLIANGASGGHAFSPATTVPVAAVSQFNCGAAALDFAMCGNLAVLAMSGGSAARVLNVTDPHAVTEITTALPAAAAVAARDPLAYLVAADGTLTIHDLTAPGAPIGLSSTALGAAPVSCVLSGNWLFVCAGAGGLLPVDVSDPAAPVPADAIPTEGDAREAAIVAGIAYVADGDGGLTTIAVADPLHPVRLGNVATPGDALGVVMFEGRAFVADNASGLTAVNVLDPAHPSVMNSLTVSASATGIAAMAGMLYIADSGVGLLVGDARYENDLYFDGQLFTVSPPTARVRVAGDYVYVLSASGRFSPAPRSCYAVTPVFLAAMTATLENDAAVVRWEALAAGGDFRLLARAGSVERDVPWTRINDTHYEARDAAAPRWAGGTVVYTLFWREGSDSWQSLAEKQLQIPAARTALLAPYPNPFNPRATVAFTLDHPQHARVTAYDTRGRLVAILANAEFPAGLTEIVWEGRDSKGRGLAADTYFIRLETESASETRRLTLVR